VPAPGSVDVHPKRTRTKENQEIRHRFIDSPPAWPSADARSTTRATLPLPPRPPGSVARRPKAALRPSPGFDPSPRSESPQRARFTARTVSRQAARATRRFLYCSRIAVIDVDKARCPLGGTGRRGGFKIPGPKGRPGSSPGGATDGLGSRESSRPWSDESRGARGGAGPLRSSEGPRADRAQLAPAPSRGERLPLRSPRKGTSPSNGRQAQAAGRNATFTQLGSRRSKDR